MSKERWRWVVGYEGLYKVSTLGRVKSVDRVVSSTGRSDQKLKGRVLQQSVGKPGHYLVNLSKYGAVVTKTVHSLVAEAFIPNPKNKPEVNHKDGNKLNNTMGNLEWVTRKEQQQHALAIGLRPKGELDKRAKLSVRYVKRIRLLYASGEYSQQELADIYGVGQPKISRVVRNLIWRE